LIKEHNSPSFNTERGSASLPQSDFPRRQPLQISLEIRGTHSARQIGTSTGTCRVNAPLRYPLRYRYRLGIAFQHSQFVLHLSGIKQVLFAYVPRPKTLGRDITFHTPTQLALPRHSTILHPTPSTTGRDDKPRLGEACRSFVPWELPAEVCVPV
jgi:hypothetical protein